MASYGTDPLLRASLGRAIRLPASLIDKVVMSPSVTVEMQIHSAVVGLVSPGARIERVHRFRSAPLPFPAKLVLDTNEGTVACVVKTSTDPGRLRHEASILGALDNLAFPAPKVLAGPHMVPTSAGQAEVVVMSVVPGEALPWIDVSDVGTADRTCRVLFDAIDRLHALTPRIAAHACDVPTRTLDQELATVAERKSPWRDLPVFQNALDALHKHVPRHRRPLVFSNGDYNPLNVLADDVGLRGWVDFEHACFEDPLIGLPKFLFWSEDSGWSLATRVGLVERFLYRHHVAPTTFMVRVVLRGLTHLHDTTPDEPPLVMLKEIEQAVNVLRSDD